MKIGSDAQLDVPTYPHVGGAKHGFDHGENGLRVVVPEALESVPDILIWQFYSRTQRILQVFSDSHLRSPSGPGTDYCNIRPTARVILLAARSTSSASTLVIDGFQYPRCDARCSAACCPGRVFAGVFGRVRLFFSGAFGHDFTLLRTIWCGRLLPCSRLSAPGCTAYVSSYTPCIDCVHHTDIIIRSQVFYTPRIDKLDPRIQ
jgi:hypothetical protein